MGNRFASFIIWILAPYLLFARRFSCLEFEERVVSLVRLRRFSSRLMLLAPIFADKEIGRFTKSISSMEEEKNTKPLLSYEEVIEVIEKRISRDEPATCDERIVRVEKVAEQMEEDRKKGISWRKKVSRFFRRSWTNLD